MQYFHWTVWHQGLIPLARGWSQFPPVITMSSRELAPRKKLGCYLPSGQRMKGRGNQSTSKELSILNFYWFSFLSWAYSNQIFLPLCNKNCTYQNQQWPPCSQISRRNLSSYLIPPNTSIWSIGWFLLEIVLSVDLQVTPVFSSPSTSTTILSRHSLLNSPLSSYPLKIRESRTHCINLFSFLSTHSFTEVFI